MQQMVHSSLHDVVFAFIQVVQLVCARFSRLHSWWGWKTAGGHSLSCLHVVVRNSRCTPLVVAAASTHTGSIWECKLSGHCDSLEPTSITAGIALRPYSLLVGSFRCCRATGLLRKAAMVHSSLLHDVCDALFQGCTAGVGGQLLEGKA